MPGMERRQSRYLNDRPRCRTSRPDDESGKCRDLNQVAKHSGSCRRTR